MYNVDRAHKLTEVPFLADRRNAHVLNFMYKRKDNRTLLNLREIRTRAHDAPLFDVNIPRCESFKRSVGYFGSEAWNALSPVIRNTASLLAFKGIQKKEMFCPLNRIVLEHHYFHTIYSQTNTSNQVSIFDIHNDK